MVSSTAILYLRLAGIMDKQSFDSINLGPQSLVSSYSNFPSTYPANWF